MKNQKIELKIEDVINEDLWHMVSVSGGKDSTATALLARERGVTAQLVFADTQHEHPLTYEYLEYLDKTIGAIQVVKADFSRLMEGKRAWIEKHWFNDLTAGRKGYWKWAGKEDGERGDPPPQPAEEFRSRSEGDWKWVNSIRPWSAERARAHVDEALAALQPTGNVFLDMCLWKGRFPSTRQRFCSSELKHGPMAKQVVEPQQRKGLVVVSWQGIRADESLSRAKYDVVDQPDPQLIQYRPIITWTADEVFDMHRKHGVRWNPLYEQGMGRVGCMPCIHVTKRELAEIARRFPEVIDRLESWERSAKAASKYGIATFGDVRVFLGKDDYETEAVTQEAHGIRQYVGWATTRRGSNKLQEEFDFGSDDEELCSSIYGLCEAAK